MNINHMILSVRQVLETPSLSSLFWFDNKCKKFSFKKPTNIKLKICDVSRDKLAIKINRFINYKKCHYHVCGDINICIQLSNGIRIYPTQFKDKDFIYLYLDLVPLEEDVCVDCLVLCITRLDICVKKCNNFCKAICPALAFFCEIPCKLIKKMNI